MTNEISPEQRQANMVAAQAALRSMRTPRQEVEDPQYPGGAIASNMAQAHPGLPAFVPAVAGQVREGLSPTANIMKLWEMVFGPGANQRQGYTQGGGGAEAQPPEEVNR